ncbi:tautomerase family protein [Nocardia sp. 2TAF39]|uniref:tautomerase family protein n=1 Tax=unclassified Nocardia TaxID=2637762 RepID=UPI003F9C42FE
MLGGVFDGHGQHWVSGAEFAVEHHLSPHVHEPSQPRHRACGQLFGELARGQRFRVDVTVPEGALSDRRKAGMLEQVTADVLTAAGLGEADALRVWVLIHEQPEGTWGAAGNVVRFAELAALAKDARG